MPTAPAPSVQVAAIGSTMAALASTPDERDMLDAFADLLEDRLRLNIGASTTLPGRCCLTLSRKGVSTAPEGSAGGVRRSRARTSSPDAPATTSGGRAARHPHCYYAR